MDSQSDRHIVQVWNADETQIEDTVLTVPNKRLRATGKTVVKFSERPSGSPEALKGGFIPEHESANSSSIRTTGRWNLLKPISNPYLPLVLI